MKTKRLSLYCMITGFLTGVFLASFFSISLFIIGICFISVSILGIAIFFFKKKFFILIFIFLFAFNFGILRLFIFESRHMSNVSLEGQKINASAKVVSLPKKENGKVTFIAKTENIKGNIRVSTNDVEVKRGDIVHVQGEITLPENFETDTGREFDYVRYLKKDNVLYQLSFAEVAIVSHSLFSLSGMFGALHDSFLQKINETISYPESSLIAGILLGAENDIPKEVEDNFRNVGLVHIVVLSGYNISIVTRFVQIFSTKLSRKMKMIVELSFIFLFVFFVGATATVVRAGVMATLANINTFTFRKQNTFHILVVAGFFMVLHNPLILVFDPSFQLSFLATAGLVLLSSHYESFFKRLPNFYKIRETVSTSLATQTFVLPLIIYLSGIISPISLLANIIVLPLMPTVMLFGFISGVLGFISTFLALPFGYVTSLLSSFILWVAEYGAAIPFSFFQIERVSGVGVFVMYGILIGILTFVRLQNSSQSHSN